MQNLINQINLSHIISVVSIFTSLTIALFSLSVSRKSLKLTQQSIDSANRPYLVIYLETIQISKTIVDYLVLKNFGKSGAIIEKVTLDLPYDGLKRQPFVELNNFSIAPEQSISTSLFDARETETFSDKRIFTIKYSSHSETYTDTFFINDEQLKFMSFSKPDAKDDLLQTVISKAASEIIRKNL